ncbi:LacI family transcriptional regulator [Metabacillus idriensis]|uniref:LacI family DNA-binding transcriptional regulator n=1 Tax=Metabacillus idriensis TaxID=324768 RepID=A0A6I2M959_9BACI|nr:LacI family DNA-binding transcriptional regulator [Metabacillus idriensis]MCM3595011.1 LacI family transcriptional regulator [Metabacillus idriensis]MRX52961.1 LacI family DNA-binding transcriptional regulator [Metabacillus idriensis]OHR65386.1 transcriptional regulator [Bacillus sp. HMSC76G11]
MSVTIKDIARESGVSYSTVSKALNNSPLVKPETKKKVLETASMLGYTPNFAAKNLVSKKSRTIGLVWPAIDRIALTALVSKINELVTAENYFMILSVDEADKAIGMFKGFQVDGVMIFEEGRETMLHSDVFSSIPILSYGVSGDHVYPIIDVNHKKAIHLAVSHLIELGHTSLSYIGDATPGDKRQTEKLNGFYEAMENAGLTVHENSIGNTKGLSWYDGYLAAKELLKTSKPTALISGSYDISVGVLRAAKELKIRIPEDLSVISYDNIPQMASLETELTSVGVPIEQLAEKMVTSLLSLIEHPDSINLTQLMEPKLALRKSTKSLQKHL